MKRTTGPATPASASTPAGIYSYNAPAARNAGPTQTPAAANQPDVFTRLKLELLDEYTCEKRGYDPYDTARNRATPDIWISKRKRA